MVPKTSSSSFSSILCKLSEETGRRPPIPELWLHEMVSVMSQVICPIFTGEGANPGISKYPFIITSSSLMLQVRRSIQNCYSRVNPYARVLFAPPIVSRFTTLVSPSSALSCRQEIQFGAMEDHPKQYACGRFPHPQEETDTVVELESIWSYTRTRGERRPNLTARLSRIWATRALRKPGVRMQCFQVYARDEDL